MPVQNGIFKIVVGAQKREFSIWLNFFKTFQTIIKIMIAHRRGIITHHRHEFKLQFTAKKIEIRCSLKNITGIQ